MNCVCDYEQPIWSSQRILTARKPHRCEECRRAIQPGERYEYCAGMWQRGTVERFKVCSRCLALREYVKEAVPCLCWAYGNIIDDCIEAAREYAHELPGLLFGAYRREVAIYRAPKTGEPRK